ncbi:unnamed protein product, partial [Porites evermanni]
RGKAKIKTKFKKQRQQEPDCEDEKLESITIRYNGKDHVLELPKNGDAKIICQNIKRETGVKGSFYVQFGDQSSNYIYCSSVTRGNIAKVAEKLFSVTGGNVSATSFKPSLNTNYDTLLSNNQDIQKFPKMPQHLQNTSIDDIDSIETFKLSWKCPKMF